MTTTRLPLLLLSLLFCTLLVVSRRPDVLFHATFWAEDGWSWYPDAYLRGWHVLVEPWTGYMQTDVRLVAFVSQLFPLAWAPTLFACSAILLQAVTATFMLSDRLAEICPSRPYRALFALFYMLLPNSFEVYANLTNAQWHLGLLAFLVTIAANPRSRAQLVFDVVALGISVLSGPFCLFLIPIALIRTALERDRIAAMRTAIIVAGALVQLWCLFGHGLSRSAPPLGAGPRRLAVILSMQVILPVLLGRHSTPIYTTLGWWRDDILPCLVALAGLALTVRTLIVGPAIVRWACLFAGGQLFAALVRPATGSQTPAWVLFSMPDVGDRYYILPMLAWAVVLFALTADPSRAFRRCGQCLMLLMLIMLPGDWHLPTSFPFTGRTDFVQRAHAFAEAPSGTVMSFPVHPAGMRPMWLTKR
ncbi:MAG: hypothetical protein ACRYGI_07280 [Janthinobacterium lividum]